jgi:hypothetical protein
VSHFGFLLFWLPLPWLGALFNKACQGFIKKALVGTYQCWAVSRKNNRSPEGIRVVLRIHNHGSANIEDPILVYNHGSQQIKKIKQIPSHKKELLFS